MDVTCAIIVRNDRILLARRANVHNRPGQWEFPGGKVHKGEALTVCIQREIREELDVNISIIAELPAVDYIYSDRTIRLIPFVCVIADRV